MPNVKKINIFVIISIAVILFSCEESSTEVVEQPLLKFVVTGIQSPDLFQLSDTDSTFIASVRFDNDESISGVWFNISTANDLSRLVSEVQMKDNGNLDNGDGQQGDGIYSGKTFIGPAVKSGKYQITFYAEDAINPAPANVHKIGVKYFEIVGGKENSPPVLTDLSLPDTVSRGQKFSFSVKAEDEDGLQDIREVYYELYNPNGEKIVNSKGISQFPMFDDGDTQTNGDETPGDGVYSVFLTFPSNQLTGLWEFKFTAVDKSDAESNQLSKMVFVK